MKKIQQALHDKGLYNVSVDGIYGKKTREALYKLLDIDTEENFFARGEFACKCGGRYCDGFPVDPCEELWEVLNDIRKHFNQPLIITSGIRCVTHNTNVGGVRNSYHIRGQAADFYVKNHSAKDILYYIGSKYIEAYAIDDTCVHIAVDKIGG